MQVFDACALMMSNHNHAISCLEELAFRLFLRRGSGVWSLGLRGWLIGLSEVAIHSQIDRCWPKLSDAWEELRHIDNAIECT